jgi:transcriptional regulator of acetoin/glycerol metabolism
LDRHKAVLENARREAREAAEREHIRRVLARCGGRVGAAAKVLGIGRTTLWERVRRLGLTVVDGAP